MLYTKLWYNESCYKEIVLYIPFASTVFLKASQNCFNLCRKTIYNLRKWHYSVHSLAALMSLQVVKFHDVMVMSLILVGFMSLLAAADKMKCNNMGSSL